MKTKPRQVITEVCKWVSEWEEVKLYLDNILTYICSIINNNPCNSKIQRLHSDIPTLQTRIGELTYKIGVGYFALDFHIPHSLVQKKKQLSINSNLPQNKKSKG